MWKYIYALMCIHRPVCMRVRYWLIHAPLSPIIPYGQHPFTGKQLNLLMKTVENLGQVYFFIFPRYKGHSFFFVLATHFFLINQAVYPIFKNQTPLYKYKISIF